jgi:hypothetical protein
MKSLTIKDLSITEELDSRAMSAVRGGNLPGYWPGVNVSSYESSFGATQLMSQSQNTVVNNGNNVAFSENLDSNVKPKQTGTNTINF